MEADWSVEVGPDLPCIESSWEGLVDLRGTPNAIDMIPEATRHATLRAALLSLNAMNSAMLTTKCDTWRLGEDEIDPYEFGCTRQEARTGFACYIDILECDAALFSSFTYHEQKARELTHHLHAANVGRGRVDIVLREAVLKEQRGYGLTMYAAGCGADEAAAYHSWERVLAAATAATIAAAQCNARASSSIG